MGSYDASLIAAGSNLAGTAASAMAQNNLNKKMREWNEKMYAQQRADSLADYHMQNEYNSPDAVMKRLKDGGLNPNLVYGNGATTEASNIKSASAPSWSPKAPEYDFGGAARQGISAYYDSEIKSATLDNLRAQNDVLVQEKYLKSAQIGSTMENSILTGTKNQREIFDLDFKKELRETSAEVLRESLRALKTKTEISMEVNERQAILADQSLLESTERILSMRATRANTEEEKKRIEQSIINLKKDARLKQLDIDMKKMGVQPGDELYQRVLMRIINSAVGGTEKEQ